MPELPEVEVAARNLRRWSAGRKVRGAEADATAITRPAGPRALAPLVGARFAEVDRVGKHLLVTLARGRQRVGLWSHLGMTGKWQRRARGLPAPRFSHARLRLDDGTSLHYCDMRQFGRLRVVPGARFAEVPELAALGPDPLRDGVDAARLHTRLARAILASIRYTLARFADEGADAGDGAIVYVEENREANPFKVYGRAGEPCPRKNGTIQRIVQAGRSTFFCPGCVSLSA